MGKESAPAEASRPLCFIDIEGTGTDPANSRIVELAVVKVMPDGETRRWSKRYNPTIPIPPEATEVHGIMDADVADCPTFGSEARLIHYGLMSCDLAGYNLRNYDIPLLWEEFYRADINWDLSKTRIIDVEKIFKKREPRTLAAAVEFYCHREHSGAHGALADAGATLEVFLGQQEAYPDLVAMSRAELDEYSRMDDGERIDLAGRFVMVEGVPHFNFGKHKGTPISWNCGYIQWMLKAGFSANTKMVAQRLLDDLYDKEKEGIADGDYRIPGEFV